MRVGFDSGLGDLVHCHLPRVVAVRDILSDRSVEQYGLLTDEADLRAQPWQVELVEVVAVEADVARIGIVETLEKTMLRQDGL